MIIYGKNPIREACFAKRPIYHLYVDKAFSDSGFLEFLKSKNQVYEIVDKAFLNKITDNALHQGLAADVKDYKYYYLEEILQEKRNSCLSLLILDELNDPHNLGAIIRTAEAVNLDGIIISKKSQVKLNGTVAKVSSGAIEHVRVILVNNINQAILTLKKHDVLVIGTDRSTKNDFTAIPDKVSTAICLGSEGQGIRPLVKKNCDMLVAIPMKGHVSSLNVSVAAALMMYMQYFKK